MTMLSESHPVARKRHQCWYCNEMIEPGERYYRWTGIVEGDFNCVASHLECDEAFHDIHPDDYVEPGEQARGTTCEFHCKCDLHTEELRQKRAREARNRADKHSAGGTQ